MGDEIETNEEEEKSEKEEKESKMRRNKTINNSMPG